MSSKNLPDLFFAFILHQPRVDPNYLSQLSLSELFQPPTIACKQNGAEFATSVENTKTLKSIPRTRIISAKQYTHRA